MYVKKKVALIAVMLSLLLSGISMDGLASEPDIDDEAGTLQMMKEELEDSLNFVVIESAQINTPGSQNVVVSIGNETSDLSAAVLHYTNKTTGKRYQMEAKEYVKDTVLFTLQYWEDSPTGVYALDTITYFTDGRQKEIQFREYDYHIEYGVNAAQTAEPEGYLLDPQVMEDVNAGVVVFDENGEAVSENTLAEALLEGMPAQRLQRAKSGQVIIALDPGHDDTHTGASYFGLKEQDLTLKIAKYCKQELETYAGVKVVMTRSTGACASGGGSLSACLDQRVAAAKKANATALVSLHLNASVNSSAHGVGVYCPNTNWKVNIGKNGQKLGSIIAKRLKALGIKEWSGAADGVVLWNSSASTYPDGSVADYLGIVQRSKRAGFPGVIVEHAFLSNESDVSKFLNSDAKLKKLGAADAKGIADYFGLKKKNAEVPVISYTQSKNDKRILIVWNECKDTETYELYRSTEETGGFTKIAKIRNALKYYDSEIKVGTKYYYKVKAIYRDGSASGPSVPSPGQVIKKAVISSVQSLSNKKIQITWKKAKDAAGYRVLRSTQSDGKYERIYGTTKTSVLSYTDKKVKAGVTYYYKVLVLNKINDVLGLGPDSEVESGWAVPNAKIQFVRSRTSKYLEVKWSKVKNAYAYELYRSTKKERGYTKVKTLKGADNTIYIDKIGTPGKLYYYKIRVRNKVNGVQGTSGSSSAKSRRTLKRAVISSVKRNSAARLKLSWNKVDRAAQYVIQRSTKKNGTFKTIAVVKNGAKTTYTDKGLKAKKNYYYRVQAELPRETIQDKSGYCTPVKGRL